MTHITCRLTAKKRDQLRKLALGNPVWATFTYLVTNLKRSIINRSLYFPFRLLSSGLLRSLSLLQSPVVVYGLLRSHVVSCRCLLSAAVSCGHLRSPVVACGFLQSSAVCCGPVRFSGGPVATCAACLQLRAAWARGTTRCPEHASSVRPAPSRTRRASCRASRAHTSCTVSAPRQPRVWPNVDVRISTLLYIDVKKTFLTFFGHDF